MSSLDSPRSSVSLFTAIDRCVNGLDDPRRLDVIRIGVVAAVLWDAASLQRYAIELFSDAGPSLSFFGPEWDWVSFSPLVAVSIHAALTTALVLLLLGQQIRLSAVLSAALYICLGMCDGLVSFKKYSVIAVHVFAILALSPQRTENPAQPFPVWPRRCVQWLLCCIYLGAAITKYNQPEFVSGNLMTFALLDDQWGSVTGWSGEWGRRLASHGQMMAILSIGTLVLEASLPVFLWIPFFRRIMLVSAVLLHLSVDATMNVRVFTPVMLVLLTSFLSDREFAAMVVPLDWVRKRLPRYRVSVSVFVGIVAFACAAACVVQWWFDWYGVFGRRELPPPRVLSAVEAAQSLTPRRPSPPSQIRQIVLGSREWLNRIVEQHEFRPDEPLRVMLETPPTHQRLMLEFVVHNNNGEEVARFNAIQESHEFRSAVTMTGSEAWPAGEYTLTMLADEFEAAEIPFRILPGRGSTK